MMLKLGRRLVYGKRKRLQAGHELRISEKPKGGGQRLSVLLLLRRRKLRVGELLTRTLKQR